MSNTEIMRQFFYDLPEKIFSGGKITQAQFDAFTPKQMIQFIDGLHMDYPSKEQQAIFEQNKKIWKLIYELGASNVTAFL